MNYCQSTSGTTEMWESVKSGQHFRLDYQEGLAISESVKS